MTLNNAIDAIGLPQNLWPQINVWRGLAGKVSPHPDARLFALAIDLIATAKRYHVTTSTLAAAVHLAGTLTAGGLPAAQKPYPDFVSKMEVLSLA